MDELLEADARARYEHNLPGVGEQRGAVIGAPDLVAGMLGVGELPADDRRQSLFNALRKGKAPRKANMDDVIGVRDSLRADLTQAKLEAKVDLATISHKLTTELQELKSAYERTTKEAAEDRERRTVETMSFARGMQARTQQELRILGATLEARLLDSIAATDAALQAAMTREYYRDEAVDRRFAQLSAEIAASIAVRWTSVGALLAEQRESLMREIEAVRRDLGTRCSDALAALADVSDQLQSRQDAGSLRQTSWVAGLEKELRTRFGELESSVKSHQAWSEENIQAAAESTRTQIAAISAETQARLSWLDDQATHLRGLVAEVENIPTRRVEWLIPNVSPLLLERQQEGLQSPTFEAAGANGLKINLRQVQGEAGDADCELALWANHGLYLVCRLYVGNASMQVQHTFDGQSPCVLPGFCMLREQICQQDDSLRVGLEILEAIREVLQVDVGTSTQALSATPGAESKSKTGTIVSYRYLNHRMLELVQSQVDLMKSRMVRRVEWRIEQASQLRRCFPEGECLCSTTFEAAGVEGLQLVFYPSGYAGAREGFCSYFLHCPAGSAIACWLAIGKQRHRAKLAFEQAGFYGRTNFCRFETAVDPDDSVMLVLEIEEALQEVTEPLSHLSAGSFMPSSLGSEMRAPQASPSPPSEGRSSPVPEKVDSSVRFRRTGGRSALEDVKRLPSIWTSRPQANLAEALEGFHTFNEMRPRRPPTSSRRAVSSASCRGESGTPLGGLAPLTHRGAKMQNYVMYAA